MTTPPRPWTPEEEEALRLAVHEEIPRGSGVARRVAERLGRSINAIEQQLTRMRKRGVAVPSLPNGMKGRKVKPSQRMMTFARPAPKTETVYSSDPRFEGVPITRCPTACCAPTTATVPEADRQALRAHADGFEHRGSIGEVMSGEVQRARTQRGMRTKSKSGLRRMAAEARA